MNKISDVEGGSGIATTEDPKRTIIFSTDGGWAGATIQIEFKGGERLTLYERQ
jgi:hypothetical protein